MKLKIIKWQKSIVRKISPRNHECETDAKYFSVIVLSISKIVQFPSSGGLSRRGGQASFTESGSGGRGQTRFQRRARNQRSRGNYIIYRWLERVEPLCNPRVGDSSAFDKTRVVTRVALQKTCIPSFLPINLSIERFEEFQWQKASNNQPIMRFNRA